jgi:hypothetical protein
MKLLDQVELENILGNLASRIALAAGDELVQIRLFGSYATGKASAESDIDVLVVLKDDDARIVESVRDASYGLMWENDFDFIICLHIIAEDHYAFLRNIDSSFYREITKKGMAVWERSKRKQPVG